MRTLVQSPIEPGFVQNPYAFYELARRAGPLFHWSDYDLICTTSADLTGALLRDRRFGRETPPEDARPVVPHLAPFYAVEAHSMLELEPPRHTRMRGLVVRAFTSRRLAALEPGIAALASDLAAALPDGQPFDLLPTFAQPLPAITIARLLGVPEADWPRLIAWSNAMVAMYQARRSRGTEDAAVAATVAFSDYLADYIRRRRSDPREDLISDLIAAEAEGERLSADELLTTCILLLNAGHEATVHTIGNGVKALLENGAADALAPDRIDATVEEILRFDPPLHLFTRWCYAEAEIAGHTFRRGDQVGLLLAAANRDPAVWADPDRFDPARSQRQMLSFGAGLHFCVGAALARMELRIALPALFARFQGLRLAEAPAYANLYHFHGLTRLMLTG